MSPHGTPKDIGRWFGLEIPGDWWDLIITKEVEGRWTAEKPEDGPWVISLPVEDLPDWVREELL